MEEAEELLATDSMGAELRAALDEHGNGLREQLNLLAASRFLATDTDRRNKCARLQRPQPSLLLPPRAKRSDAISEEVKEHVLAVYQTTCPTSPHQKDQRKRHLSRYII
ncbi:hypothetical protein AB1Y20_012349 [Prymnesium parvum]|uniref:Uncharacterized protein n=1 Tax=Prymnesium parvum TaxID=97485 RepID=A0AB34INA0_PRYPA